MSWGRVLVVCTGNVCRSAYLERLLRRDLSDLPIEVESAGLAAVVGHGVESRVAERLEHAGASPEGFRARQATRAIIEDADLVVTVSQEHQRKLLELAPRALRRTWTLLELAHASQVSPPAAADTGWLVSLPRNPVARLAADLSRTRGDQPRPSEEASVVPDPWRRPDEVVEQMVQYIEPMLPPISDVLRSLAVRDG